MNKTPKKKDPKDPYDEVTVKLPKYVLGIIRDLEQEVNLPIGRLIGYALDNEMSKGEERAFRDFECSLPETSYVPHAYATESSRVLTLLERFTNGIGLDGLALLRFGIGVPNKLTFLSAVRELLEERRVEFRSVSHRGGFRTYQFAKDYKLLFVKEKMPLHRLPTKVVDEIAQIKAEKQAADREILKLKAELAKRNNS